MKTIRQYVDNAQQSTYVKALNLKTRQVETLRLDVVNAKTLFSPAIKRLSEGEYDNYVLAPKYEIGQEGYVIFNAKWVCKVKIDSYTWEGEEYKYECSKIFTYPPKEWEHFECEEFESKIYPTEAEALVSLYNQIEKQK